jgi:hypothetical protein
VSFGSPDANGSYHPLSSPGTGSLILFLQANYASALRFLQEKKWMSVILLRRNCDFLHIVTLIHPGQEKEVL